jgi:hypothetical protein
MLVSLEKHSQVTLTSLPILPFPMKINSLSPLHGITNLDYGILPLDKAAKDSKDMKKKYSLLLSHLITDKLSQLVLKRN